jgi:hypothetical protein
MTLSTMGELDNGVERRNAGRDAHSSSHKFRYTFSVAGTAYHGTDTIDFEPRSRDILVYYDNRDPAKNGLQQPPANESSIIIGIAAGMICGIVYFTLPIFAYRRVPNGGVILSGKGDAAGEYLTMRSGAYSATHYVALAFGVQLCGCAYLASSALLSVAGSQANNDLLVGCAAFASAALTLAIFWDRWKCITIYSSNFCSGCLNLSVIYVPVVAIVYANYRGLLKLTRR